MTNAARNVFLTNKLFEILNLFKEDNITALPFKAPVLAEAVYGDMQNKGVRSSFLTTYKTIRVGA